MLQKTGDYCDELHRYLTRLPQEADRPYGRTIYAQYVRKEYSTYCRVVRPFAPFYLPVLTISQRRRNKERKGRIMGHSRRESHMARGLLYPVETPVGWHEEVYLLPAQSRLCTRSVSTRSRPRHSTGWYTRDRGRDGGRTTPAWQHASPRHGSGRRGGSRRCGRSNEW